MGVGPLRYINYSYFLYFLNVEHKLYKCIYNNYQNSLLLVKVIKEKGYPLNLFLAILVFGDPRTKSCIRLTNPAPATGFRVSAASASGSATPASASSQIMTNSTTHKNYTYEHYILNPAFCPRPLLGEIPLNLLMR
jgi:hypothetical protein